MVTRFCTKCWASNREDDSVCVRCGVPLTRPEDNGIPYTEKLLTALRHPEAETRERAATLLGVIGEPGDQRIVRALIQALEVDPRNGGIGDIGLREAACKSLGTLGACEAAGVLSRLALDERTALLVSLSAVESLAQLAHDGCGQAELQIERIVREAWRDAIRDEAEIALARLNEPQ
jgi:HEAT repeat protein